MPALTKTTQAARILQAMQTLQLIIQGVPQKDACDQMGISVDAFNNWISQENEALEALQRSIAETERVRLTQIANAQAIILSTLISQITDPDVAVHPDVKLRVLKYLDGLREDLETKHGVNTSRDTAEEYLQMTGPQTRTEDSQMMVEHEMSRATVNIKTRPDGSVDLTVPHETTIIDMFPELRKSSSQNTGSKQDAEAQEE